MGKWILGLLAVSGLGVLLAHRSLEPFLARYSLPYLFMMLGYGMAMSILALWVHKRGVQAQLILFANLLLFLLLLVLVEVGGQIYAQFHPAYSSLFLEPDPVLNCRAYQL